MARLSMVPTCCGAHVIHSFWNTPVEEEKQLKLREKTHNRHGAGLLMIILNGQQKRKYHRMLYKNGYRIQFNTPNPRHNSKLYLFVKKTPKQPEYWKRVREHQRRQQAQWRAMGW